MTNNKKIRIKAKSGSLKTNLVAGDIYPLKLGKTKSGKGTRTTLSGFYISSSGTVFGGSVKSCTLTADVFRSKLTGCTLQRNLDKGCSWHYDSSYATFNRCKVFDRRGNCSFSESKFANCLFVGNGKLKLTYSTLANCTIADNWETELYFVKAYNTIFHNVPKSQFNSSNHNTLKSCYRGSNPKFVRHGTCKTEIVEVSSWDDYDSEVWDDSIGDYRYYATTTTFTPSNYHLAKGSPCINKGTKAKAAKKLYGTKDLAGKKRVKGKSVDIGCYEY